MGETLFFWASFQAYIQWYIYEKEWGGVANVDKWAYGLSSGSFFLLRLDSHTPVPQLALGGIAH